MRISLPFMALVAAAVALMAPASAHCHYDVCQAMPEAPLDNPDRSSKDVSPASPAGALHSGVAAAVALASLGAGAVAFALLRRSR